MTHKVSNLEEARALVKKLEQEEIARKEPDTTLAAAARKYVRDHIEYKDWEGYPHHKNLQDPIYALAQAALDYAYKVGWKPNGRD